MRAARTFTVTLLATALICLLGLGSLSGIGKLVSDEPVGSPLEPATFGTLRAQPTFARSGQFGEITGGEPMHLPDWVGQLIVAVVVGLVALVVLRFVFLVAARVEARRNEVAVDAETGVSVEADVDEVEVQESVEQTLDDLRSGVDVHGAVIECWRRLADLAADSGVRRRASQTAEEYTVAILGKLPVEREDLRTLARLYEAAMFSGEDSPPADRDTAIACLERLSESLAVAP